MYIKFESFIKFERVIKSDKILSLEKNSKYSPSIFHFFSSFSRIITFVLPSQFLFAYGRG